MTSRVLHGDCLQVLRTLPEASVHCVVTSPPYWSLRDYGVPPTVWGGDRTCAHDWVSAGTAEGYTSKKKWQHSENGRGEDQPDARALSRKDNPDGWNQIEQGKFCARCDAWLGCLGLEPTPELYVAHIVGVFEQVRRVLRRDGTLWLNLGDCYAAGRGGDTGGKSTLEGSKQHQEESKAAGQRIGCRSSFRRDRAPRGDVAHKAALGLKPKDLVGIPWMVAFALRAAGWYLRSDIVWAKTNPMPESIRDRPTKSHEYVFLLAKCEEYFYDADAVREGVTGHSHTRGRGVHPKSQPRGRVKANVSFSAAITGLVSSRNRRSVWTLPTSPFPGAHFATFPARLVEPCILAGTSAHGCCSVCGAPFRRIVEFGAPRLEQRIANGGNVDGAYHGHATKNYAAAGAQDPSAVKARILEGMRERRTVGWRPTCRHTLRDIEPCVVLDPFHGSGTTGMVAERCGRDYIGIELNGEYLTLRQPKAAALQRT